MRIFITGFDARCARLMVGESRLSFAYLLHRAFQMRGHEVFGIDSPLPEGETADLALVGVGSPLSLSATYLYPTLQVMEQYGAASKLIMFLDDPDLSKIWRGFRSVATRKTSGTNPLFDGTSARNRRGWTKDRSFQDACYAICEMFSMPGSWPTTLVPVQNHWSTSSITHTKSLQHIPAVTVDPTNVAFEVIPPVRDITPQQHRSGQWWVEPLRASKWATQVLTKGPKREFNSSTAMDRLFAYQHARGVLESPAMPGKIIGWWTPTATIAACANTFYGTDVEHTDAAHLAESNYNVMPQSFESLPASAQMRVAEGQADELTSSAPTIRRFVEGILHEHTR